MSDPLTLAVAVAVGTLAVARATRLVVHDSWPPMAWVRESWEWWQAQRDIAAVTRAQATGRRPHPTHVRSVLTGWGSLLTCPFCFAPYAAAADMAWALLAGLEWGPWWSSAWWVVNLWAAVSYVAAMIVVRDEPEDT